MWVYQDYQNEPLCYLYVSPLLCVSLSQTSNVYIFTKIRAPDLAPPTWDQ